MNGSTDDLRRLLHRAFDGEQPRPGLVDDIVQKVRADALPRPARRLRPVPLAGALALPLITAGLAVAFGVTHHSGSGGSTAAPAHPTPTIGAVTPSPTPLTARGVIPWAPLPPSDATPATPGAIPVPPDTPPCRADQVEGAQLYSSAAAGNGDLPITLRNRSATACALQGYPDLIIEDATGRLLTQSAGTADRGTFFDNDPAPAVLLEPGTPSLATVTASKGIGFVGQAYLHVQWTDCSSPVPHTATVDLPGSGGRVVVPFTRTATTNNACYGNQLAPRLLRGPVRAVTADMVTFPLRARIAVPPQVRAGTTLTYDITLTNPLPVAYDFQPCPSFSEMIDSATGKDNAEPSLMLNCAAAHRLGAGDSLVFEMRLDVPRTVSGTRTLTWELSGTGIDPTDAYATAQIQVLSAFS